ncbi:MAG: outer membrane protein assembly factor BamA [Thermodesulfovibrionales bacterium]
MRKIAFCLVVLLAAFSIGEAQVTPRVTAVEVRGLKRVEEGAVKAKISQKIGDPVSQEKTNADIKTIYKMGYFDDVKIEIEAFEGGARLVYLIKEKPAIIRVEFQGNEQIKDDKLKEKVTITPGAIADTVLIQDNASILTKFYEQEGYSFANVVPVVKKVSEDEVTLTYQITEGSKVKIRSIIIEGNAKISSRTIKKAMETKEWWLFSFIDSSGYYRRDMMQSDLERIKNVYFNEGYIKIMVAEPEIQTDAKGMTIRIRVSEGEQFKLASIDFSGNKAFDADVIRKKITLVPNTVFRKNLLEKDMRSISDLYSQNGYALVSVVPNLSPNEADRTVQVTLSIDEGDKFRIGKIEISGNTKTRDKVIRREVRLDEGDTFDSSKLRRSYERINNLNFFEDVQMTPKPRADEKVVDIDVRVKEKATGFLSIGGGYSSQDKFVLTADITQGNLFGRGQYIKLKGEIGGTASFYEFSFRDPYFLDSPYSFSIGAYKNTREYIEYDKEAWGGYVGLGKTFSEYIRGDITYNFERATIKNVDDDASHVIKDEEGTSTTSSITLNVVRDSRDNYMDPTRGSRNSLTFTFAGLGGSNAYIKGLVDSGWYFPFYWDTTFSLRGRFGYSQGIFGKDVPLYEHFYVGGINTVRGLGFGEAGPRDVETNDPIGGTTELIFNAEYIFPVYPDLKLKGLVFFDAGNAYDDFHNFGTFRYTSGVGLRWLSPMGPIRLEWGYNLNKHENESSNKFEFAFGSAF